MTRRIPIFLTIISLLLALPNGAWAQKKSKDGEPNFTSAYNRFDDQTNVNSGWMRVPGTNLQFICHFHYKGQAMDQPVEWANIIFLSRTREWTFLKQNEGTILADGARFALGAAKNSAEVERQYSGVREMLIYPISRADLAKTGAAGRVEIQIGTQQFVLSGSPLSAMSQMAEMMQPVAVK